MRTFILFIASFLYVLPSVNAQDLAKIRKQMHFIPVGNFSMGGGYSYQIKGYSMEYISTDSKFAEQNSENVLIGEVPTPNNPRRQVKTHPFYLSDREVTNLEYRQYLVASSMPKADAKSFWETLKKLQKDHSDRVKPHWEKAFSKAVAQGILPELAAWTIDSPFAYNKPLDDNYFWHPAFDDYPVVGVSWSQANGYCNWLTRVNNADRLKRGKSAQTPFRLPTEAEWEYAARGLKEEPTKPATYPWEGKVVWNEKGQFNANIRTDHTSYIQDGFEYTAPVGSFPKNGFGLHDMAGNVAEWTSDYYQGNGFDQNLKLSYPANYDHYRVTKGGSWADYHYAAMVGSRCFMAPEMGYSRVGFRVARTVSGAPTAELK